MRRRITAVYRAFGAALLMLAASQAGCSYDYADARHCRDGSKNSDETDVDCGGSCIVDPNSSEGHCRYGKRCLSTADCDAAVATCELGRCTPNKLTGSWRLLSGKAPDPPRFGSRLSFQADGQGILIGGYLDPGAAQEIFVYVKQVWSDRVMGATPRFYQQQAFDSDAAVARVVIAGGQGPSGRLDDTWQRTTDNSWKRLADLPATRSSAAMVYDRVRMRMLLYGEASRDEVWTLDSADGAKWQRPKTNGTLPEVPWWHSLVYDSARDKVLLFGGRISSASCGTVQTGILDPASLTWEVPKLDVHPSNRFGAAMAYDPNRQRVILFGGRFGCDNTSEPFQDTWEWNGSAWTELEIRSELPTKSFHDAMDYDPVARQMVLFLGGKSGFAPIKPNETWTLSILGWPCASASDCGEDTVCVDNVCCESSCEDGSCSERDQPGICVKRP